MLVVKAIIATDTPPMRSKSILFKPNPVKISVPKPPAPMYVASVALEIISTNASFTPVITKGKAIGIFTLFRSSLSVMPKPFPVSIITEGTSRNPTVVLTKIGGIPNNTKAINAGALPTPIKEINKKRTAKLGMIRKAWELRVIIWLSFRCLWLMYPSGIPIRQEIPIAWILNPRCW